MLPYQSPSRVVDSTAGASPVCFKRVSNFFVHRRTTIEPKPNPPALPDSRSTRVHKDESAKVAVRGQRRGDVPDDEEGRAAGNVWFPMSSQLSFGKAPELVRDGAHIPRG